MRSDVIAFDPGTTKGSAFARFIDLELVNVDWWQCGMNIGERAAVWIEKPRIYPGKAKGDLNDLIDLACVAGQLRGQMLERGACVVHYVEPRSWKGQHPKPISHRLIWNELTFAEQKTFEGYARIKRDAVAAKIEDACTRLAKTGKVTGYSWQANDLLDAVGIGLYALRRL